MWLRRTVYHEMLTINMSLEQRTFHFNSKPFPLWVYFDKLNKPWFRAIEFVRFMRHYDSHPEPIQRYISRGNVNEWKCIDDKNQFKTPEDWSDGVYFINEIGLYQYVFRGFPSMAMAEFQLWLNDQVLPVIRQGSVMYSDVAYDYVFVATNRIFREQNIYRIGYHVNPMDALKIMNATSPADYYYEFVFSCTDGAHLTNRLRTYFSHHSIRSGFYFNLKRCHFDNLNALCRILEKKN